MDQVEFQMHLDFMFRLVSAIRQRHEKEQRSKHEEDTSKSSKK